ncbi:MAG: hypothetical protein RQ990_05915 [Candidatus Hydrothermia bacterium]|nr:hypothetical protein [Candidatus Hydrothermia bacterium]
MEELMQVYFGIMFPLTNLNYYKIGYSTNLAYNYKKFEVKLSANSIFSKGSGNYSLNLLGLGIGKKFSFLGLSFYEFLIFRKYQEFYEYGFNPSISFSIQIGSKFSIKSENYYIFGNKRTLSLMAIQIGFKL